MMTSGRDANIKYHQLGDLNNRNFFTVLQARSLRLKYKHIWFLLMDGWTIHIHRDDKGCFTL